MNNEKILYYLGILENGALNYYQTIETIRIASQSIQDYIEQLEQQCKKQKEVINKANQYIQNSSLEVATKEYGMLTVCDSNELLQMLEDKEV